MTIAKRIIPCLDVDNGIVMKGRSFVDLRIAGDPVEMALRYREEGADELVFLDITATIEARKTLLEVVKNVAEVLDIPFTVGGESRAWMMLIQYSEMELTRCRLTQQQWKNLA